jgi:hypothetical protein
MKFQSSFSRGDEGSLHSSRNSRAKPYSETEISSQEYQSHFLKTHFNIILTPIPTPTDTTLYYHPQLSGINPCGLLLIQLSNSPPPGLYDVLRCGTSEFPEVFLEVLRL